MNLRQEIIINLLKSTKRQGVDELIQYLNDSAFFIAPASTKYHGSYTGGLADHSINVLNKYQEETRKNKINLPVDSVIICSLLHDICKIGLYLSDKKGFRYNKIVGDLGHANLSIKRIQNYIELTQEEINIISFHMGMYGSKELLGDKGEYTLKDIRLAFNNKAVKLFHMCDDYAAQFIDK